jgi:hypothetical protein
MALPHIKNSTAGVNRQDPVYKNKFEVYFTIPEALQAEFGKDVAVLTEQIQKISGMGSLDKGVETGEQKFMGTTRTYLNSAHDNTSHEISVEIALNFRNRTDNYIYRLFRAWNSLGYNLSTGETTIKQEYVADYMRVVVGNRAGDIWRDVTYKDIIMFGGIEGLDELDYSSNDVVNITVKFKSDWADDNVKPE